MLTLLFTVPLMAQDGSLSEKELRSIRASFTPGNETLALMNAISNNNIKDLALSRKNRGKVNEYFSDRIDIKGITDQKSSGRCWLFTGLNMLRVKVIEKFNLETFKFSENYSFFWDQFEKSNLYLEGIIETADKPLDDRKVEWLIKHPIGDGGQWTGVVDIIEKYGLVPSEAMPESKNSENTSRMRSLIRKKLRKDALMLRKMIREGAGEQEVRKEKINMLKDVYKMLVLSLGEPPQTFTWQYKDADGNISEPREYTPHTFFGEVLDVDLGDYVMFMNDPTRAYGKLYEIEYDRHMYEGSNWKYINLEIDLIKDFAAASLKDKEAMYFSCDVGKQLDKESGTLDVLNYNYNDLFGIDFTMTKAGRISTFQSASSHGMSLIGVNILEDGTIDKWLLENSWGNESGYQGLLIMTDKWFDEYMFRLVVHKDYVDEKTLEILETKPIVLPPWDPMY